MHFYRILYIYSCEGIHARTSLHILCSSQGPLDQAQVTEWLHRDVIRSTPTESEMQVTEIDVQEFSTGVADYRMMF